MDYSPKRYWKVFLTVFVCAMIATTVYAQVGKKTYTIRGNVFDSKTSDALVGANVVLEATVFGAVANQEGRFSITGSVSPGKYKLTYRLIGYKKESREIQLGDEAAVEAGRVGMEPDVLQIQEVVVTGTGAAVEKERLGNTIATVRGTSVIEAIAPTLDAALVGKIPGALVQQNSGTPGGGVTVRLRGTSTISSSAEPLYIVDGVIVDNSSNELVNLGGYVGNRIADLDAKDIDHIEVVKGAAAAALYGSRANNGIIQIFTKRGQAGAPRITFMARAGVSEIRKLYEVNLYPYDKPPSDATRKQVTRTDYQKEIFRTGYEYENYLSLAGGNDQTKYYLSGSHSYEAGIMKATDYRKINFRANIDQLVSDWIKFSAGANYIRSQSDRVPNGGVVGGEGVLTNFSFQPNWLDLHPNAEGKYPAAQFGFANELEVLGTWKDPLDVNRFIGNLRVTATPLSNVSFDYVVGYDQYTEKATREIPRGSSAGYTTGFAQVATQDVQLVNNDFTLTHTTSMWGIGLNTTLGFSHQYFEGKSVNASVRDLIPVANLLSAGATATATEYQEKRVIYGSFIQETINLIEDKLFLTGALRVDGSSTFGEDNRWQLFPKASLSYLASNEEWWQNAIGNIFNRFKFRTAWGQSGGQPAGSYDRFSVYVQQSNSNRPGLVNSTLLGNENLKPERMREWEIGADAGLFNDRVSLEFSYYNKRVEDLLLRRTLPTSTGFIGIRDNVGILSNKGFELLVKGVVMSSDNFQWVSTLTVSRNTNKVEKLNSPAFAVDGSFGISRVIEGEPLGIFYGPTYARNTDGTIKLDSLARPIRIPTASKIGDPNPDYVVSFVNDLQLWRNLSLHVQFDGIFGQDVFNFTRRILETPAFGNGKEYEKELKGEVAVGYFNTRRSIFEEYIEDGSFIKLRELSLTYTVGQEFAGKFGLKGLTLKLTGRNLFSIDDYSGYDPEVNVASQSTLVRGFDWSTLPLPRTFSFGITANL